MRRLCIFMVMMIFLISVVHAVHVDVPGANFSVTVGTDSNNNNNDNSGGGGDDDESSSSSHASGGFVALNNNTGVTNETIEETIPTPPVDKPKPETVIPKEPENKKEPIINNEIQEEAKIPWWFWILLLGMGIMFIVLLFVLFFKKKKKDKETEDEEVMDLVREMNGDI